MGEDLRVVKTRRAIKSAFLELRAQRPLEKVYVRDICSSALINKSTFYHHYTDVFDLSDKLEDEVIAECFEDFSYSDRMLSDPLEFLQNVPEVMDAHREIFDVLFSGRQDVLFAKIERNLRALYLTPQTTVEEDVLITFVIGGSMHAMQTLAVDGTHSKEKVTEESAKLIGKLVG